MKEIELTQGYIAIVDDEDFERINKYSWHARKVKGNKIYAGIGKYLGKINGKYKTVAIHMHWMVLDIDKLDHKKVQIDHINGNGLDNRKENLRFSSPSENRRNLHELKSNNTSGYRGVSKRTDKKDNIWRARIYLPDGSRTTIGHYDTAEKAARAFDKAAKELYGNFCGKLNFDI